MKKLSLIAALLVSSVLSSTAMASPSATAVLTGFLQNGTISNDIGSGASITSITYSLGTPGDGIATWDTSGGGTAGGVASGFLSDANYYQTVTWGGLNIAAGSSFNFFGLDIDLIQTLSPLSVTGSTLDFEGSSLINATLAISWSDGSVGSSNLIQQDWESAQTLQIGSASDVPEPQALLLVGVALAGLALSRRKQA